MNLLKKLNIIQLIKNNIAKKIVYYRVSLNTIMRSSKYLIKELKKHIILNTLVNVIENI